MAPNLPQRPKLKRGFSLVPISDGVALLCSADRSLLFRGKVATALLPRLLPLLDGTHTVTDIAATCPDVATDQVEQILALCANRDLLERGIRSPQSPVDQEFSAFLDAVNIPDVGDRSLQQAQVLVVGDEGDQSPHLCHFYKEGLSHMGVANLTGVPADPGQPWADLVSGCDLVMFMPDRPALQAREAVHAACMAAGVKLSTAGFLTSTEVVVGPTVVPGDTACWKCYEHRVKGVQDHYVEFTAFQQFLRENPEVDPVSSRLPALGQTLAGMAAFETVRILTNLLPPLTYGAMITLNCMTMSLDVHDVLKLPRCPVCGPARTAPPRRVWSW